jgi:glycosyltransferase involved in cell wall biosynthesis
MRVLHLYSGNLFGGIETILLSLAKSHSENLRHDFALCFHGKLDDELARAGASPRHLGAVRMSRPTSVLRARKVLSTLLTTGGYERVICHAPWTQGLFGGVVRRAGLPLVFWAHDAVSGRHWTEKLARRVTPDLVICNSRFTAGTLPALYPRVPSMVVYAPVDLPSVAGGADLRRKLRNELRTADDDVVLVSACRSERWKGHTLLVQALADLKDVPGWTWWQVGGAQRPAERRFLQTVKQSARRFGLLDRIRWLGERNDVAALMASADLYCQPNLAPEPFGIAFVEALAAGLPVVASASGGALEIVDETCGRLVPAGDRSALALALSGLIENRSLRARLSQAAPTRARHLCDPAEVDRRLFDVLSGMESFSGAHDRVALGA